MKQAQAEAIYRLKGYPESRIKLAMRREEIEQGTRARSEGRQGGRISDSTAERGIRLAELAGTPEARWAECIAEALKHMPGPERETVSLRYFERLPMREVAARQAYGRAWAYRLLDRGVAIVVAMAAQQGLVVITEPEPESVDKTLDRG